MIKRKNNNSGIVYSTEHGKMCPACSRPVTECICRQEKGDPRADGIVRVGRQTKGRKGKGVTLISGVPLDHEAIKSLGKELKKKCGTGGTVKDGIIEIQGDHRGLLVLELEKKGWTVKRSGG
ncbi:MAG: translation initiation factor Sui1 [Desulfobacteraceae bacterium]|nr:translation initiation factor Sui1 [Desulfobacteraceae bacterium]MBC2756868.1 translation initiation factor Sui1 [Desulfobacteraceae bacterium]